MPVPVPPRCLSPVERDDFLAYDKFANRPGAVAPPFLRCLIAKSINLERGQLNVGLRLSARQNSKLAPQSHCDTHVSVMRISRVLVWPTYRNIELLVTWTGLSRRPLKSRLLLPIHVLKMAVATPLFLIAKCSQTLNLHWVHRARSLFKPNLRMMGNHHRVELGGGAFVP